MTRTDARKAGRREWIGLAVLALARRPAAAAAES